MVATETSRFWDGTTTGDATTAPYDAGTEFAAVVSSISGAQRMANQGVVLYDDLSKLAPTAPSANTLRVASGRAIVYGTWYYSDGDVDTSIPTPAAATRIDRIVLRKSWTNQTVRVTRIVGVEGGAAPAMTQSAGTTWDFPICQVSITTGGVMTITDQRVLNAIPAVDGSGNTVFSSTSPLVVRDSAFTVTDESDTTKAFQFQVSGVSTGTTRVFTVPNASGTLALLSLAQTWSAVQTYSANVTISKATPTLTIESTSASDAIISWKYNTVEKWQQYLTSDFSMRWWNGSDRLQLSSGGVLTASGGFVASAGGAAITGDVVVTGLVTPTKSQDGASISRFTNSNGGTSAQALWQVYNGSTAGALAQTGTAYTSSVTYDRQDGTYLSGAGAGGVSIAATHASGICTIHTGGNTQRLKIDSAGIVSIGSPGSTSGAGAAEVVLQKQKGIYSSYSADTSTAGLIRLDANDYVQVGGFGNVNAYVRVLSAANTASVPAGSANTEGLITPDKQTGRLYYVANGTRYYLVGTAG